MIRWINSILFGTCLLVSATTGFSDEIVGRGVFAEDLFPELYPVLENLENHAPQLQIAEEYVNEAAGEKMWRKSAMMPKAYIDANANYVYRHRSDSKDNSESYLLGTAAVTQPLFHWGGPQAEKRIGELKMDLAWARYMEAISILKKEVRGLYLEILLAKIDLSIAQLNANLSKERLQTTEASLHDGRITEADFLTAKLDYDRIVYQVQVMEFSVAEKEERFRQMSGTEVPQTSFDVSTDPQFLINKLQSTGQAITYCPESKSKRELCKELEIEQNLYKKLTADQLPKLNLNAGIYQDQVDSVNSTKTVNRTNYFGGLNVHWNVFDGCLTPGLKIASRARQRRLRVSMDQEDFKHAAEYQQCRFELDRTFRELEFETEFYEQSRGHFEHFEALYEDGRLSEQDLNQQRINLFSSKRRVISSLFNFLRRSDEIYQKTSCCY